MPSSYFLSRGKILACYSAFQLRQPKKNMKLKYTREDFCYAFLTLTRQHAVSYLSQAQKISHIRHNAEDSKKKKTNCNSLYFFLIAIIIVINYVTHGCAEVLIYL